MVGDDLKGVDEDRRNDVVPGDDVKGSVTGSDSVRQKKLGGDRGNVEDTGGVLPLGGQTDCRDDGKTCGGQDVGISPGGGGFGSSRLIPHT